MGRKMALEYSFFTCNSINSLLVTWSNFSFLKI